MDVVVIGGGLAGTEFAFALRKNDKSANITVLEASDKTMVSKCSLPYLIGGKISDKSSLYTFKVSDFDDNDINLLLGSKADHIDRKEKIVHYTNSSGKKKIHYDRLIIATGSRPMIPMIQGITDSKYHVLSDLSDAEKIISESKNSRSVVVIGGGYIGIETAISIASKDLSVNILESKDHILSSSFDPDMAVKVEDYLNKSGIILHLSSDIISIVSEKKCEKKDQKKGHILLNMRNAQKSISESSVTIPYDMILVSCGVIPDISLAKDAGLETSRGIIVNNNLQTSDKDIFACGDAVMSKGFAGSDLIQASLATNAIRQAHIIADKILSKNSSHSKTTNANVSKIGDLIVASCGITESQAKSAGIKVVSSTYEGKSRSTHFADSKDISVKLISDLSGKIVGCQIIGFEGVAERVNSVSLAICNNLKVSDLIDWQTCYNPSVSPLFDPVSITAGICQKKINLINNRSG